MRRAFIELQMICEDEYSNKAILTADEVENNKYAENRRFESVELRMKIAISLWK